MTDVHLNEDRVAFLTRRVSILAGSCDAEGLASVARAYGCRIGGDGYSVTVFLATAQSQAVLRDLRAGGRIAVVFTRPTTHETVQLKGPGARIAPLAPGDRECMRAYAASFGEEIGRIGFAAPFARAIMAGAEDEALAVHFVPDAAFEQTPGPAAGQPLRTAP